MRAIGLAAILTASSTMAAAQSASPPQEPPKSHWQYGAFGDIGVLGSFSDPPNHLFRSRGTTPRVDELNVNMSGAYLRKTASERSRWGLEIAGHAGQDSKVFGFSATAPNTRGADWLTHLGPTNVSYLAANDLTVQAGIFSSFIGYDGLYAKDNFTYTRPWSADFTPYLMLGVNVGYPVSDKVTVTGLMLNGYWHLAHANDVPSVGGQVAFKASDRVTLKQTMVYGPHQARTSLGLWRVLSNTIIERRTDRLTTAIDFHVSSEVVDIPARPRAWWVAGQVPVHWTVRGPWSVTLRPEFAWDSEGRWTTFDQTVRAMTSTIEHRTPARGAQVILRLEHRYDRSTGPNGGFFTDTRPGEVGLTPSQHLAVVGLILTFDGTLRAR